MTDPETTHWRARIAWSGASPGARAIEALAAAGYCLVEENAGDVAVYDVRGAARPATVARDLATITRPHPPRAGAVVVADADLPAKTRAALMRHGDVVFVRRQYEPLITILRQRLRLAARAEETGERLMTLAAMAEPPTFPDFGLDDRPLSVLIAGRPGAPALAALNAARPVAGHLTAVFNAGQVMRALDHTPFDAAVFIPDSGDDLLVSLARALRRHREFRRLPILFAASDADSMDSFFARNGFESVLYAHLGDDLSRRLENASRRVRASEAMRAFLNGGGGAPWRNPGAGLPFFAHHGARLAARARETGRPLALVGLSLRPKDDISGSTAGAALSQSIRLIDRITRAEDLALPISREVIGVLAPGVARGDADAIAQRIMGVVSGGGRKETMDQLAVSVASVSLLEGETLEELTARLFLGLRNGRDGEFAIS